MLTVLPRALSRHRPNRKTASQDARRAETPEGQRTRRLVNVDVEGMEHPDWSTRVSTTRFSIKAVRISRLKHIGASLHGRTSGGDAAQVGYGTLDSFAVPHDIAKCSISPIGPSPSSAHGDFFADRDCGRRCRDCDRRRPAQRVRGLSAHRGQSLAMSACSFSCSVFPSRTTDCLATNAPAPTEFAADMRHVFADCGAPWRCRFLPAVVAFDSTAATLEASS